VSTPGFRGFAVDGCSRERRRAGDSKPPSTRSAGRCRRRSPHGANIIVLSDRKRELQRRPIRRCCSPPQCTTSRPEQGACQVGLVIESGDAFGGAPLRLAASRLWRGGREPLPRGSSRSPRWCATGLLASCRSGRPSEGISRPRARALEGDVEDGHSRTVASYTGAQVFEAIGLDRGLRTGTSMARRAGWAASGWQSWPRRWPGAIVYAYEGPGPARESWSFEVVGEYKWRGRRATCSTRRRVFKLQHATRAKRFDIFRSTAASSTSSRAVGDPARPAAGYAPATLRCGHRSPREVEPVEAIRAAPLRPAPCRRVDLR